MEIETVTLGPIVKMKQLHWDRNTKCNCYIRTKKENVTVSLGPIINLKQLRWIFETASFNTPLSFCEFHLLNSSSNQFAPLRSTLRYSYDILIWYILGWSYWNEVIGVNCLVRSDNLSLWHEVIQKMKWLETQKKLWIFHKYFVYTLSINI